MTTKKQPDEISQTGWRIPRNAREKFVAWCDRMGTKAQEDCAGALIVWPRLPSSLREKAKLVAKEIVADDEDYWKRFQEMMHKLDLSLNSRKSTNRKVKRLP